MGGPEAKGLSGFLSVDDYLVYGPGEGILRTLAESGFSLPGGIYDSSAPPLSALPFPYKTADKPRLQNKLVYYETSRGCPFRCIYCLSAEDNRREQRFSASSLADRHRLYGELDKLVALQPRTIKFVDRSFNLDRALCHLIWNYAIKAENACEFHFEIYPDLLSDEDILLLEQAPPGRIRFEIGIQTINAAVSRRCRRNSNWHKAKAMIHALRTRSNICLHTDLLAGLPGENYRSILHSLDELALLLPHEIQLGMLKILPDTPMLDIARMRGYKWMEQPPYQILCSDALSFEQVTRLQELARILNLYWNKEEFSSEWALLLGEGHKASVLLNMLLSRHHKLSLPLHSISKQHRREIFSQVFPQVLI